MPTARVKELLREQGLALEPCEKRGWGPAHYLRGARRVRHAAPVGFIGAMTENFCDGCNRARVAADGGFQACLGGAEQVPLGELLRAGAPDEAIEARVRAALGREGAAAPDGGGGSGAGQLLPMRGIGGWRGRGTCDRTAG